MSDSDHVLADILEWFTDLEAAIPGVRSTVGEILIGKIPESDIDAIYDLAGEWAAATELLAAAYEEAVTAADGILDNWTGDGAAAQFTEEWFRYLDGMSGTVQTLAGMEQAVQSFGLQIELMKFMAAIGLIMLAVSLFMLVAAAIPSLGLSTAGVPGAFAACRTALAAAASNAMRAIGSISVRTALADVAALLTRTLPTLVRTQLPTLVRTQVPRFVTTQLPRFATTQIPRFATTTLPGLVRTGAGSLARNVLPRNVIARSVADRMAAQWLRGVTNREVLRQLGRQAGLESRRLAGRSLLAARNQLAREIEEQLLRKFGSRAGAGLALRGGTGTVSRVAGGEVAEQLSRQALSRIAAQQIAETTFGRELAKYVGVRMAFGAGFMGGSNLLVQVAQIADGNRTTLDLGDVAISTAQGAAFGASMWGGIPGHIIGGGIAGSLVTGATDAMQGRFDLQNMLHGGAEGAKAGAIFGAQNRLETARVGVDLRVGRDVVVLPEGLAAVDRADGVRLAYGERGVVWDRVDATGQRIDGGAIAADGTVVARDTVTPDGVRIVDVDGHPADPGPAQRAPVAQLPPADAPHRGGPAGGDGGGGGPRQPAGTRTPDATVRTAEPARPATADGGRPGTDRPAPPRDAVTDGARPAGDGVRDTPRSSVETTIPDRVRPDSGDGPPPDGTPARPTDPSLDGSPVRPVDPVSDGTSVRPVDPVSDGVPPGARLSDSAPHTGHAVSTADAPPRSVDGQPTSRDAVTAPARDADPVPTVPGDRPPGDGTTAGRGDGGPPSADRSTGQPVAGDRTPGTEGHPSGRDGADRPGAGRDDAPVHQDGESQSGGAIRPRDHARAMEWAEEAYTLFRASDADVADMARHLADVARPSGQTGFTRAEIAQVKQHLMVDEHTLRDYPDGWVRRRFDADEDIAEAWIRLREGRPLEPDLVLLEHELAESNYMRSHPDATYPEAHAHAQNLFNWEQVAPGRTGENLYTSWPRETSNGNLGGLREGPGGQSGGRVRLRLAGDGPSHGHREGLPAGETLGRQREHAVQQSVREDPAVAGERDGLAGGGLLRGLTADDGPGSPRLVPVDSEPIGPALAAPETVASALDGHVRGLLDGRPPGPVDQPHRASWDDASRLLTVHYPDGVSVRVALQVNTALPPGTPVVVRPPLTAEHGGWVQAEPAGVVLSGHVPADPTAGGPFVSRQLGDAWRTLHQELHRVLDHPPADAPRDLSGPTRPTPAPDAGPPGGPRRDGVSDGPVPRDDAARDGGAPRDPARYDRSGDPVRPGDPVDAVRDAGVPRTPDPLADPAPTRPADDRPLSALEEPVHPDPPVLGVDQVGFRDATPAEPGPPRPLTPDAVRDLLADRTTPDQVAGWTREHLAVRQEDGSYAPRSQAEIDATVSRFREDAGNLVAARVPADPGTPPATRPGHPDADGTAPATRPGHADADATAPAGRGGAAEPAARAAQELRIAEELAPSVNFPEHRTRTGAELPEQVHELVARAKDNLLARYPESAVAARIADLDAIGGLADRLQAAADRARESGELGETVQGVRDLSRAVNEYADRYRDWRDFERDGGYADPGWRDLDGVDPLNSVEMAHRVVTIDPTTHRFHVLDQAIAVAKIGEVLGSSFEGHAARTFDRIVPKDIDSVRALLPPEARTPELDAWVGGPARGGLVPRHDLVFVDPNHAGQPRSISAVAATVVHESMHRLQPSPDLLRIAIRDQFPSGAERDAALAHVLAHARFEGEFQAFTVQRHFLQGLAGFRPSDHAGDPRLPRSDGYQEMADWTPEQVRDHVLKKYFPTARDQSALVPEMIDRLTATTPEHFVERARVAIDESTHPLSAERRQGTFHGPMTRDAAARYGVDVDAVERAQTTHTPPAMLDRPATTDAVHRTDEGRSSLPLAEWGPGRDSGPVWPTQDGRPAWRADQPDGYPPPAWRAEQPDAYAPPPWRVEQPGADVPPVWRVEQPAGADGPAPHAADRADGGPTRPDRTDGEPTRPERRRGVLGRAQRWFSRLFGGDDTPGDPAATLPGARPDGWPATATDPTAGWPANGGWQADGPPARPDGGLPQGRTDRPDPHLRGDDPAGQPRPDGPPEWSRPYPPAWGVAGPHADGPGWAAADAAPARPEPADPQTGLRLRERDYVVDEFRATADPAEQARLRAELRGIDADLAQRGYPVHRLERLPDADHPADATPGDGRDLTRHDEIWADPPWHQEDRRPSLDELIPGSDAEVAAWGETVRREFADQLDGREFAGMRIRLDLSDPYSVSVHRDQVIVRADIIDPDRGSVGRVVRAFSRDHDGSLYVEHTSLKLSDSVQGRGFAREWNSFLEDWYRYSGVERIEIHASSTVGGYAWARAGYDWAPNTEHRANAVFGRLRAELREVDVDIDLAGRLAAGDGSVDAGRLRDRYGTTDPDAVLAEAHRQREAGRDILDRAATNPFRGPDYPTPFEVSQAGWGDHHQGRDASWVGKRALLGADWKGVKPISDGGPLYPRAAHSAGLPRLPDPSSIRDLLSGGPAHPPVTAARVPDSGFHAFARDTPEPELVQRLGDGTLRQAVDRLPAESPLRGVRLDLRAVPAETLPGRAVARSVPVDAHGRDLPDGTVPPEGGGWRIELSDRATDVNVTRAVAHEVAELTAVAERAAGGLDPHPADALRPGEHADGAGLSPHDLGRLAEVEVLADLLRDPAQAAHARAELGALRDHLGLHPDDPGAAARMRLVDQQLSAGGREALVGRTDPPVTRGRGTGDGVPDRTVDDAAHPPARADDRPAATAPAPRVSPEATTQPARDRGAPFDFERFFRDPRWSDEATLFEQRLGVHYFNDPQTLDAVRGAVVRLRDVLVSLAEPLHPAETRAELVRRVEGAFFRDDAEDSAGQVGTRVGFDELLARGNVRETMTAFYNAAYFNREHPSTLAKALLAMIDGDRWEVARDAGVDVGDVARMRDQLDESWNRTLLSRVAEYQFARDPFATGNVVMVSQRGARNLAEVVLSQHTRADRDPAEQAALASTPAHYARLGAPLGELERAYLADREGRPIDEHTRLPWREGAIYHHKTAESRWAQRVGRDGFPVIDGVSATTTRMLTAARFIGLDRAQGERFLGGLMGWMLPARDHSLFEILRGAEIAGLSRVDLRPPGPRFTAVDLYRSLPDLDLPTLRAEVAVDRLFPHEARYLDHATDPAGFSETQHKVGAIADRLWPQLENGRVRDPDLADWLRRNGIDPADQATVRALAERISKPHVMALTVYTRHSHYLINNVVRSHLFTGGVSDLPVRAMFNRKIEGLVGNYLGNLAAGTKALPLPLLLRPVVHHGDGHLTSRSPLEGPAQRWVDGTRRVEEAQRRIEELREAGRSAEARQARVEKRRANRAVDAAWDEIKARLDAVSPRLFDEMRWHADMVHDAMLQLPAVGSPEHPVIAYRGDWITPVYSPIYGSSWAPHGQAREFLSVSRLLDVAVRFMSENPARGGSGKVLVVYRLTGRHARDISVFSSFAEDQEAVFPPGSRMRRVSDPDLVEQVRDQLPEQFRDSCEIIVMEEA